LIVGFYVSMPILAPVMMKLGMTGPASVVYRVYSPMCHQFAFRSFFLFGDQPAYPRELAGSTLTSYGTATGLDEWDVFQARAFVGNEKIGYKMALCERDISIYLGIVFAGLAYGVARRFFKVKPLPLALWALLGIAPIALDGGSQLLSQIPALPLAMRESTPWLRSITGALFGMMNVWMAYPYVEQSMVETRLEIASKLAIAEEETRIQQAEF
jgi:uncharacterized membrane protein